MKKLKENVYIIVLAIASFFTHFIFFGYPRETVFDEVHFGKFISGYFNGEYFFDIHPPLAKLLITGFGALGGYRPAIDFSVIGEHFTDTNFIWLRLLPALAGALLPIVIYYLCRELNFSKLGAFVAGMLVVLENSLLVQSRFILLDSILLLFGFGSLLLYFLYLKQIGKRASWLLLLCAIISASFAISIKWTGATFIVLILILECIRLIEIKTIFKELVIKICLFLGIPFLLYYFIFFVHFAILNKTGPGDAFMTPSFQKTLEGSLYESDTSIAPLGLFAKFTELNLEMFRSNQRLEATHPYGSKWYTWPLMGRPIYYWVQSEKNLNNIQVNEGETKAAKIYLLGNPFIYWLGSASVIYFIFYLFSQVISSKENFRRHRNLFLLLFIGFILNLLPFIFIGRVMFLYHYFSSLIFSIIILSYLVDEIQLKKARVTSVIVVLLISAIMFAYFSPLSYGLPLTKSEQGARFWFNSWE